MAKKRRKGDKDKEAEYEFKPPEFDEKEFIKKELSDTRTVVFTVIYGVVLGVVAGLITIASRQLIGPAFLVVIAGMFSLRWIYPLVKIDTKAMKRRSWVGNIGTFFFTFLAIWILLMNEPFADFAKPTITEVTVWVEKTSTPTNLTAIDYKINPASGVFQWTSRYGEDFAKMIHSNASYRLNLSARVADNHDLKSVQISVNGGEYFGMTDEGKTRFGYTVIANTLSPGVGLSFRISALDGSGNSQVFIPQVPIPVSV